MFTLTGKSPSRLSSFPSPLLSENDFTERVRTGLNLLDSDNVKSLTSPPLRVLACNECCLFLSSEMEEKLIELVRKCEELYNVK